MNSIRCDICNLFYSEEEMVSGRGIPKEIETLLKEKNSLWDDSCNVCPKDYNQARIAYVKKVMEEEVGNIEFLEQEVFNSVAKSNLITANDNQEFVEKLSLGDKIADKGGKVRWELEFYSFFLFHNERLDFWECYLFNKIFF
ncbi:PF06210 family protein [Leptospira santarosai]|uniref:PF06210 family protein n=1 Tax=Leptospira santarosai TaxID=28183 RepID=A0A2P1QNN9_9LEPT|nr:PF06210 family protein [Leptospira santarosai]